jgi:hypothetical protein
METAAPSRNMKVKKQPLLFSAYSLLPEHLPRLHELQPSHNLSAVFTEVTCANALTENEKLNNVFDVVLTNPPFGSKGKVEDPKILKSYVLARRWNKGRNDDWEPTQTALAGQSPEILFIEKCLKLLFLRQAPARRDTPRRWLRKTKTERFVPTALLCCGTFTASSLFSCWRTCARTTSCDRSEG